MSREPTALERAIGWTFRDSHLLTQALTHSTYANEHPEEGPDNERLEFVGDAVLALVTAQLLFRGKEKAREGEMSRRRARVVRRDGLAAMAEELSLALHLKLGEGLRRRGHTRSILADAYEALVGAVFLDGGYEAAFTCFARPLEMALETATARIDFKTHLQELCHRHDLAAPAYVVTAVDGPDHERTYACEVRIGSFLREQGDGPSKKAAEQACARKAVGSLTERYAREGE